MSTGLRFTLEVDGLPPDAFAVVSFHLTQSLSSLFSLALSLVSQQFLSLEFAQVLDKMAYLTIWQGDEVQRRVKGVVTWFELGENDKNQMLYLKAIHRTDNGIQTLATYEQDARGRLTEADARLDYHLFYEYDAADRIIRWSDNDQTWSRFTYDAQGRCVTVTGAEG